MKQGTRVEVNTFVKGLVTEASPLNFPANASVDEVNFELLRDGTRKRRLGMDFEDNHWLNWADPLNNSGYVTKATNSYLWESVAGNAAIRILVVQVGNRLVFHRIYDEGVLSTIDNVVGSLDVNYSPDVLYSFTTANGKLVVAGGGTHIAIITYVDDNQLGMEAVPIRVRDVWGLEEPDAGETDIEYRSDTISKEHEYNLCNQSWGTPRKFHRLVSNQVETVNPAQIYRDNLGKYPSNSEVVWTGLQFQSVNEGQDPYERIYPNLYEERLGLDLMASRGHFVINLHNRGLSRETAMHDNHVKYPVMPDLQDYPEDKTNSGPTVVGSYAGRVFYAGFSGEVVDGDSRSPVLSDHIFFSQLIKTDKDINACYQSGDPTSRENSDLLETDGGFIRIADAQKIVALREVGKFLAVIANNGVWIISGGSDYGFSATNYRVEKVTTFGCVAPASIVELNGDLMYWGAESIYKLGADQLGGMSAQDFTAAVINTYYDNIPSKAKRFSRGVYDSVNKRIRWLYHIGELFTDASYTVELVFDTLLGSFYQHRIKNYVATEVVDLFYTPERGVKYLALHMPTPVDGKVTYTVADYTNARFRDWYKVDSYGEDAKAYMMTGALTAGDSGIAKQSPYLTAHFRRTETVTDSDGIPQNQSSCFMRCQWEWANDPKSKKFSSMVEIYRYRLPMFSMPDSEYDNGFETIITKSKLRGRGKAITLYFETSPEKDCQLLGWNLTINGNAVT